MRAVIVLMLLFPSIALAQERCAEGRVRGAEGFCCWPAQTYSMDQRRCEGAPACPEGLVEHGEACVASVAPLAPRDTELAPPPLATQASTLPPPMAPPAGLRTTSAHWPVQHEGDVLHRAVPRHGEDGGLVAAAMVVFDVGWMMGLLVGMLDEATGSCRAGFFGSGATTSCNAWPVALIPVGGGITAGLAHFGSGRRDGYVWGFALGIPSVLLQSIGLIMMAVALANEVHDIGTIPLGQDVRLSVVPGAQSSDVGVSAVLSF